MFANDCHILIFNRGSAMRFLEILLPILNEAILSSEVIVMES